MAKRKLYNVTFKRQRKGKTDYRKRLKILLSGKPRLVIRKSLKSISAQIIEYGEKGDKIVSGCTSHHLKNYGWKAGFSNLPSAYLTGLLIGKKAEKKGIKELIADIGLHKSVKGAKVYALLKGTIDAGINLACSEDILPKDDRIIGAHIKKYAESLAKDNDAYSKRFSNYLKNNFDPLKITENFETAKNRILGEK